MKLLRPELSVITLVAMATAAVFGIALVVVIWLMIHPVAALAVGFVLSLGAVGWARSLDADTRIPPGAGLGGRKFQDPEETAVLGGQED